MRSGRRDTWPGFINEVMAMDNLQPGVNDPLKLPEIPEPLQVELEFTNACNARCSACPRSDMPKAGLMSQLTLDLILDGYLEARPHYSINKLRGGTDYPKVTVAGGGDPLIHPRALDLLSHIVARDFKTHLITNASKLTPDSIQALVRLGLSSISVSFWGVQSAEYERAMKLPYQQTLSNVEQLAAAARSTGVPLCILWVRTPEITSTNQEIAAFWGARKIEVDLTDNHMWNRGGLTTLPRRRIAPDVLKLPDLSRRVWCSDLFFSDTYRWNGDCILCCCNYFTSQPHTLGNIQTMGLDKLASLKAQLLTSRPVPAMCRVCELPRRARGEWLGGPWLVHLQKAERDMLIYD